MKKKKVTKEKIVESKLTFMDIVHSLNPPIKRLSFFDWLNRYL